MHTQRRPQHTFKNLSKDAIDLFYFQGVFRCHLQALFQVIVYQAYQLSWRKTSTHYNDFLDSFRPIPNSTAVRTLFYLQMYIPNHGIELYRLGAKQAQLCIATRALSEALALTTHKAFALSICNDIIRPMRSFDIYWSSLRSLRSCRQRAL